MANRLYPALRCAIMGGIENEKAAQGRPMFLRASNTGNVTSKGALLI